MEKTAKLAKESKEFYFRNNTKCLTTKTNPLLDRIYADRCFTMHHMLSVFISCDMLVQKNITNIQFLILGAVYF